MIETKENRLSIEMKESKPNIAVNKVPVEEREKRTWKAESGTKYQLCDIFPFKTEMHKK